MPVVTSSFWRQAWRTAHMWAPSVAAVIACLAVVVLDRQYSERIARLEGYSAGLQKQVDRLERASDDNTTQIEIAALKNWIVAVYERGSSLGWELPSVPRTAQPNPNTKGVSTDVKRKPEKAPMQPPSPTHR